MMDPGTGGSLRKRLWIISVLFPLFLAEKANAVAISPVVGAAVGSALVSTNIGYTAALHTMMLGGGLFGEFYMSRSLSLELGALYMPRGFVQNVGSVQTVITFTTVQIPLMIRVYSLRFFFLGAGVYFTHGFGGFTATTGGVTSTRDYNVLSFASDDYGPVVNFGIKFPLARFASLVVQGRFMYGLPNISQSGGTVNLYDIQALGGLKFELNRIR